MATVSERLWRALPEIAGGIPVDGAVLTSAANCRYLSGFASSAHTVFITKEETYFLTDFRYGEAARKKSKDCKVVTYQRLEKSMEEIIRRHELKNVLFEHQAMTLADADRFGKLCQELGVNAVWDSTLDNAINAIRSVKTPAEVEKIKAAQALTDAAFAHILPQLQVGKTERDIALEIEFFMRKNGADGVAFDLIVVSGANGSQCHGVPGEKTLEQGDFITMDTGALLDGYHSDMTRTVALGSVSEEQKKVYHTVLQAQIAAIQTIRAGIHCHVVDRAAREIIDQEYPGTFGHTTGHSLGVEIHEWPYFGPACEAMTRPGMVMTVEPGIYLEGKFGVRIEDMVLITETGCENLTHSPKELIIV